MNIIVIGLVLTVIFLIVVLIYVLSMNKDTKKTNSRKNTSGSRHIDIKDINFPKNIETMNSDFLYKASKSIFDAYKALSYLNKQPSALDKVEWHTWQVAILLSFLKNSNNFFVSENNDKLFHSVILKLDQKQIEQELEKIYKKYDENVNIHRSRDELSKEVIWTAKDVTIIFYKMKNR